MSIDWQQFTPFSSLAGGILIGVASVMFILLVGRIAGISGILGGLLAPARGDVGWRLAFLGGLVAAPLLYMLFAPLPAMTIDAGYGMLALAGFLVGLGSRYGGGCTSGHGVCGLSRLSVRSLVATMSFMMAGFATVYVVRHLFA